MNCNSCHHLNHHSNIGNSLHCKDFVLDSQKIYIEKDLLKVSNSEVRMNLLTSRIFKDNHSLYYVPDNSDIIEQEKNVDIGKVETFPVNMPIKETHYYSQAYSTTEYYSYGSRANQYDVRWVTKYRTQPYETVKIVTRMVTMHVPKIVTIMVKSVAAYSIKNCPCNKCDCGEEPRLQEAEKARQEALRAQIEAARAVEQARIEAEAKKKQKEQQEQFLVGLLSSNTTDTNNPLNCLACNHSHGRVLQHIFRQSEPVRDAFFDFLEKGYQIKINTTRYGTCNVLQKDQTTGILKVCTCAETLTQKQVEEKHPYPPSYDIILYKLDGRWEKIKGKIDAKRSAAILTHAQNRTLECIERLKTQQEVLVAWNALNYKVSALNIQLYAETANLRTQQLGMQKAIQEMEQTLKDFEKKQKEAALIHLQQGLEAWHALQQGVGALNAEINAEIANLKTQKLGMQKAIQEMQKTLQFIEVKQKKEEKLRLEEVLRVERERQNAESKKIREEKDEKAASLLFSLDERKVALFQ